ncbi:SMP-30/gluconolactonase/LRE family protein [Dehalococcoidia bacterium]|nr:SMP-30/gluconolactonase/LRE family protein [Dehalococcoidia bacterium]
MLYWTDITGSKLRRYDPASGLCTTLYEGATIGGFTLQADDSLLLFMAAGAISVLSNGHLYPVIDSLQNELDARFNDVIADPQGRVFCGTISSEKHPGSLYRLDLDGSITRVVAGVGISNGLGFSPDLRLLYYVDTPTRCIDVFNYDNATGSISNRRTFVNTINEPGSPDGITVDSEGFVWCAQWGGWTCIRFSPNGIVDRRFDFPARNLTSMTFAGDDMKTIYFTSANTPAHTNPIALASASPTSVEDYGSEAGKIFSIDSGIKGCAEFRSHILL